MSDTILTRYQLLDGGIFQRGAGSTFIHVHEFDLRLDILTALKLLGLLKVLVERLRMRRKGDETRGHHSIGGDHHHDEFELHHSKGTFLHLLSMVSKGISK